MSLLASSADAFNGRFGIGRTPTTTTTSSSYSSYSVIPATYLVVPYYYCPPTPATPTVIPVPDARPGYANPVPAPPSSTGEPPLQKGIMPPAKTSNEARMPVIVTSHAQSGLLSAGATPIPKDRCRVGFWNLSGRDVTLVIGGQTISLAKDRAVTMDLERQFAWQVEGRPQHVERVGEGQATHEVVIRE
jgi:hypothetical protein